MVTFTCVTAPVSTESLLNGQVVRGVVPLRDGDVIAIGEQRYRFETLQERDVGHGETGDAEATHKLRSSGGPVAAPVLVALVGMDSGFERSRWELREPLAILGRDADCQVCIADLSVSRRHAQILQQPTGFFISDLQSSNSTTVNGTPLDGPVALHSGDVVQVGKVSLRCEAYALPAVDRSAPTTALEPSGGPSGSASVLSAPEELPELTPVGTLTAVLHAISGQPLSKRHSAPRFGPPRLRPSRTTEPRDQEKR